MNLQDVYYWPNMQTDLEKSYIPSCSDCQWNKSRTTKVPGPLHPLPIPDDHGDSVALNFIGPLPKDDGYNCILTMTKTSSSINGSLGDNFVSGSLWEVVRTIKFCIKM